MMPKEAADKRVRTYHFDRRALALAMFDAHVSNSQLAELAGLHRNTIYFLLKGLRQPSIMTVNLLARTLGVDADRFLVLG